MKFWRRYRCFHRLVWCSNPFLHTLYEKTDLLHHQSNGLKLRLHSPQSNDKKKEVACSHPMLHTLYVFIFWQTKKVFRRHTFWHFKKLFFCFFWYKGVGSNEVFLLHLVSPKPGLRITQVLGHATRDGTCLAIDVSKINALRNKYLWNGLGFILSLAGLIAK